VCTQLPAGAASTKKVALGGQVVIVGGKMSGEHCPNVCFVSNITERTKVNLVRICLISSILYHSNHRNGMSNAHLYEGIFIWLPFLKKKMFMNCFEHRSIENKILFINTLQQNVVQK
jgi:hypothetical protein